MIDDEHLSGGLTEVIQALSHIGDRGIPEDGLMSYGFDRITGHNRLMARNYDDCSVCYRYNVRTKLYDFFAVFLRTPETNGIVPPVPQGGSDE